MTTATESQVQSNAADLLTLSEAAAQLRRPDATLRYWRYLGTGPRSFKMRGRVFYRQGAVDEWLAAEEKKSVGQDSS